MADVTSLNVTSVETGETVGTITLDGDTVTTEGAAAEGIFAVLRRRTTGADADRFRYLAEVGWTNGYLSLEPSTA